MSSNTSGEPNVNRKFQVDEAKDSEMSVDKPDSGGTLPTTTTSTSSEATPPPMLPYSKERERITKSDDFLDKLVEEVKGWKEDVKEDIEHATNANSIETNSTNSTKVDLFKRSISESPNLAASRETLTGSSNNIANQTKNPKFGSAFNLIKPKKFELTSFDSERLEDTTPERRKSGNSATENYVLEENVLKKAASIN